MLARWIYTLLLFFSAPLLLAGLYKKKPGKPSFGPRWKEHFGYTPPLTQQHPVWIHAVSVGEAIAAVPVIKALKAQSPNQAIVVTTTTSTGAQQIEKLGDLVEHRYMPIDFKWCVRGFINQIKPSAMLIMETELWPNTLATVHDAGIPVIVMNARLSERSAQRYARFQRIFDMIASNIDHLLCLHSDDAKRFEHLGIAPDKVTVTGSVKFDIQIETKVVEEAQQLRQQLGNERPIWVAASTHKGEDEKMLDAFKQVKLQYPNSLLILVPRHPERFNDVDQLCQERQYNCVRRTSGQNVEPQTDIYLADTMGEMLLLMGTADITVMCGSFIGDKVGGHNMLEPAALAKPILTGPSYYNFADITQQLENAAALQICQDTDALAKQLLALFGDAERRQSMGGAALKVVKNNQGAVTKTLEVLAQQLRP